MMNIAIIFHKSIKKLSKCCEFLCYFKQNVRNNYLTDAINPSFLYNSGKLLLVPYTKDFRRITRF